MSKHTAILATLASFIATRTVQATPATRQTFYDLIDKPMAECQNPADDGYLVVNSGVSERNVDGFDGYVSWLPKLAFDEQYKPNHTPVERMQIELDDLDDKLGKIETFIAKGQPVFLTDDEWVLLKQQHQDMLSYRATLAKRLEMAKAKIA